MCQEVSAIGYGNPLNANSHLLNKMTDELTAIHSTTYEYARTTSRSTRDCAMAAAHRPGRPRPPRFEDKAGKRAQRRCCVFAFSSSPSPGPTSPRGQALSTEHGLAGGLDWLCSAFRLALFCFRLGCSTGCQHLGSMYYTPTGCQRTAASQTRPAKSNILRSKKTATHESTASSKPIRCMGKIAEHGHAFGSPYENGAPPQNRPEAQPRQTGACTQ